MTPKETERLKKQIADVKKALAAEKRNYGDYHDGRGMRYYPPKVYLKLQDYKGGLAYTKWFHKNFSDDSCYPDFLFAWTVILFKTGNIKDAEKKAFETFCSNTYLFDKFFGRPIVQISKYEGSNIEMPSFVESLEYSSEQAEFKDFSQWLSAYTTSESFLTLSAKFIEIYKKLKTESDYAERGRLLDEANALQL